MANIRYSLTVAASQPFLADPKAEPACRGEGVDPEWFFPAYDDGDSRNPRSRHALARAVCNQCPLREACADWAADTAQMFGIWGGLGRAELQQRGRCRRGACHHPEHRSTS